MALNRYTPQSCIKTIHSWNGYCTAATIHSLHLSVILCMGNWCFFSWFLIGCFCYSLLTTRDWNNTNNKSKEEESIDKYKIKYTEINTSHFCMNTNPPYSQNMSVLFVPTWNHWLNYLKLLMVFITLSQFMSTMYHETPWACRDQALLNGIIHLWPPCRDVAGIGLSEIAGKWSSLMQNPATFPTPTPPSTLMSHICKVWDERFLVLPHHHDSY